MFLDFEKWHGCLNDFLVLWVSDQDGDIVLDSLKRQAVRICDRRAGVGADGFLILRTAKRDDLTPTRLIIINSDGSIAQNCGNGLRCAALSILKRHREKGDPRDRHEELEALELDVEGRTLTCRFLGKKTTGGYPLVAVEMGVPKLGKDAPWHDAAKAELESTAKRLQRPDILKEWSVCDVGNPHVVITLGKASRDDAITIGPALQQSSLTPANKSWDGINVHIVEAVDVTDKDKARAGHELGQPLSEIYRAYVWERGAGETPACGTGACAIAAAVIQGGLVERSQWVGVDMPGGRLYVKHEDDDEPVVLAGPGMFVFSGKVEI